MHKLRGAALLWLVLAALVERTGGFWTGAGSGGLRNPWGAIGGAGGGGGLLGRATKDGPSFGPMSLLRVFNGTLINSGKQQKEQQRQQLTLQTWWDSHTKGSRGILVWLMPAILSQLVILRTVVPFFTDRLSQYMQPLSIAILLALTPARGLRLLQNICLASAAVGTCFMFRDTYLAGSSWLPLETREDSYAVVTGATSGLGRAFAQLLYAQGFSLVLVARQEQQLREFKQTLLQDITKLKEAEAGSGSGGADNSNSSSSSIKARSGAERDVILVPLDLSDIDGPINVLRELRRRKVDGKIDVLVNNAEVGSRGALIDTPMSYLVHVVDLNIRATVALTRLLTPRMIKRDSGARILIVGSIAAAGPGPDVAVYTASKAFLSSFAHSLRRELLPQGVMVTLGLPGPTVSKDGTASSFARASGAGDAFIFKLPGLATSTEEAARVLYQGLRLGRDVVCPSLWNRFYVHVLARLLPNAAIGAIARVAWHPPPRWLPLIGKRSRRTNKALPSAQPSRGREKSEGGAEEEEEEENDRENVPSVERDLRRWFNRFWYSPVINYGAIKSWLVYPFQPKGQDVTVEDDNGAEGRARRGGLDGDEGAGGAEEDWEEEEHKGNEQDAGDDTLQRDDDGEWDDSPSRGEEADGGQADDAAGDDADDSSAVARRDHGTPEPKLL